MKSRENKEEIKNKMSDLSPNISIITLNVNGLNIPIKRQRLAEWTKNYDPTLCYLKEALLKNNNTGRLKTKRWKNIYHANINQRKAGAVILI